MSAASEAAAQTTLAAASRRRARRRSHREPHLRLARPRARPRRRACPGAHLLFLRSSRSMCLSPALAAATRRATQLLAKPLLVGARPARPGRPSSPRWSWLSAEPHRRAPRRCARARSSSSRSPIDHPALCLSALGVWAYYKSWDTAASLYTSQASYRAQELSREVAEAGQHAHAAYARPARLPQPGDRLPVRPARARRRGAPRRFRGRHRPGQLTCFRHGPFERFAGGASPSVRGRDRPDPTLRTIVAWRASVRGRCTTTRTTGATSRRSLRTPRSRGSCPSACSGSP